MRSWKKVKSRTLRKKVVSRLIKNGKYQKSVIISIFIKESQGLKKFIKQNSKKFTTNVSGLIRAVSKIIKVWGFLDTLLYIRVRVLNGPYRIFHAAVDTIENLTSAG